REGRRRGWRLEDRRSADDVIPAGRRRDDQECRAASDAPDREPVDTHSITHSTGRSKEKALQQKSLQSLIFTQSGRRDLNPRPPEPHSGALPSCATSRTTRRPDAEMPRLVRISFPTRPLPLSPRLTIRHAPEDSPAPRAPP